jgi:hypothetical protein
MTLLRDGLPIPEHLLPPAPPAAAKPSKKGGAQQKGKT